MNQSKRTKLVLIIILITIAAIAFTCGYSDGKKQAEQEKVEQVEQSGNFIE